VHALPGGDWASTARTVSGRGRRETAFERPRNGYTGAVSETREQQVVREVREKTRELASLLDDFGDRLRRMRQRNRDVEQEIASFESELERLRAEVLETRP
jgi:hypothetical protein